MRKTFGSMEATALHEDRMMGRVDNIIAPSISSD
jgi:hypothetical protein